jgi:hypothetical protein
MRKLAIIVLLLLVTNTVFADVKTGVQAGFSSDPDQVYGGIRFDLGTLLPGFNLVAIGDIGFGEDVTLLSFMGDLQYKLPLGGSITPYFGFGVGYILNVSGGGDGFGLSIPIGFKFDNSYFVEVRLGFEDSPDLKVCLGFYL